MVVRRVSQVTEQEILSVVDIGFGFTKVLSSVDPTNLLDFPSAVVVNPNIAASHFSDEKVELDIDSLMVEVEGKRCYVGERALSLPQDVMKRTEIRNRVGDFQSRALFQTAIALSLPEQSGEYNNIYLVTGLPNDDFKQETIDELSEFLLKPFSIKLFINNEVYIEKHIQVSTLKIYRQPEGTYAAHQYRLGNYAGGESLITKSAGYKNYLAIFDVGQVTTDYCLFKDGEILFDSRTTGSYLGISEVYAGLEQRLEDFLDEQGFSSEIREQDLDRAIETNTISRGGNDYDIQFLVEDSIREFAPKLANTIHRKWKRQYDSLEKIIGTGGGVELIGKEMDREFKRLTGRNSETTEDEQITSFVKMSDSQYANALGYYILGVKELAKELGDELAYELYGV